MPFISWVTSTYLFQTYINLILAKLVIFIYEKKTMDQTQSTNTYKAVSYIKNREADCFDINKIYDIMPQDPVYKIADRTG